MSFTNRTSDVLQYIKLRLWVQLYWMVILNLVPKCQPLQCPVRCLSPSFLQNSPSFPPFRRVFRTQVYLTWSPLWPEYLMFSFYVVCGSSSLACLFVLELDVRISAFFLFLPHPHSFFFSSLLFFHFAVLNFDHLVKG